MASNNADPLPAVNPETDRRPIKDEPQELTKSIATTASTPPPSPPLSETPDFNNQLVQLRNLSTALSTFFRCYDELQIHLDFIKTFIDSKLPHNFNNNNDQLALILIPEPTPPNPSVPEPEPEPNNVANSEPEPEPESEPKAKPNSEKPTRSELESLCESMCGRSVRKYVVAHLSEFSKLREEVSEALKFASNPAKLVLDCIGRFYVQGSKAYTNNESPLVGVRKASVLVLECFLLMGCDGLEIDNAVVGEAAEAAVAWRKRMISEGGVHRAVEIDARGLLFLISCFGIPSGFKSDDIRDLIMAAHVRRISRRMSKALPRSTFLVPRIPEIIESMVKNKMEIEGADIAFTFGLEDKCSPQKILTTFLRRTTNSRSQGSSAEVKETKKRQLADLKSVIKCLEAHKVDPANLLPEWKINEKMTSLQKEIAELDKRAVERATAKRKAGESESSKKINAEDVKRSRLTGHNVTRQVSAAGDVEGLSSYSGLPQTNSFLGRRVAGNAINGYSASPSILHGSGQSENIAGSVAAGAGLSIGLVHTNPYARVYEQGTAVNSVGQMANHTDGRPYGYVGDTALNERLVSQAYAGLTYAPQHGDTALHGRLVSQGFAGQAYALKSSSAGLMDLYRPSPSSLESFAGLPKPSTSAGVWTRGSGSDLYQFADFVLESESYRTSGNRAAGGNVLPGRHSSYLY